MKISHRKFKHLIKHSWKIPSAGELPDNIIGIKLKRKETKLLQNLSAAIVFSLMCSSMFFIPNAPKYSNTLSEQEKHMIISYILSINFLEEER